MSRLGAGIIQPPVDPVFAAQGAGHHTHESRQFGERAGNLVRSAEAQMATLIWFHPGNPLPLHFDLTGIRQVRAAEDIDQGGLAGAVRPDEADCFPFPDVEAQIMNGRKTSKALGYIANLQDLRHLVLSPYVQGWHILTVTAFPVKPKEPFW